MKLCTYVDKVSLEELVTFHEASFGITDGYAFDQGTNDKINNVIKDLYELTLKLENDRIPHKLLLNSYL